MNSIHCRGIPSLIREVAVTVTNSVSVRFQCILSARKVS